MIKLPWDNRTAPNVMLEVTDACNVKCRACYKRHGTAFKTLEQLQDDLEAGAGLRFLHTVTISGGEPTLHPELCRIIELVKRWRVHVFLLTNGVLLDAEYVRRLKASGLDSILFHVDPEQRRPDLPANPGFDAVKTRLMELIGMAVANGLDVSVSATLYDENPDLLRELSRFVFDVPEITFLFVSHGVDAENFMSKRSSGECLGQGEQAMAKVEAIRMFYARTYGVEPYAYIPAAVSGRVAWFSYFVPIVYRGRERLLFQIRSNWSDLLLMELARRFTGRYIHKTTQQPGLTLLRVVVNALTTFRPFQLIRFLATWALPSSRLLHKVIAYDSGPVHTADGRVDHCAYCPTAIVRNQVLLPCCVADYGPVAAGGHP